jgi:hypothetical protein
VDTNLFNTSKAQMHGWGLTCLRAFPSGINNRGQRRDGVLSRELVDLGLGIRTELCLYQVGSDLVALRAPGVDGEGKEGEDSVAFSLA